MRLREKVDGLLLLNVYFMPLLTIVSFAAGLYLMLGGFITSSILWLTVVTSFYCFVGNYAPFFEIGVGAYLDGRRRIQWLAPLMIFSYLYNVIICGKAFIDLLVGKIRGSMGDWEKTEHVGAGTPLFTDTQLTM